MEPTFVHLHNHSEYCVLDGCLKIDALVAAAYDNNMPAVAMTDHGNIFGAVQFFKAAKAKGVKPILGCEVYVAPQSRFDKKPGAAERRPPLPPHPSRQGRPRLQEPLQAPHPELPRGLLLPAADRQGAPGGPRRRPHRALEPASRARSRPGSSAAFAEKAEDAAREYAAIFAPRAISTSSSRTTAWPTRKRSNPQLVGLARKLGLPLVATNDIHFARREDAESQDVLVCIQTNRKISDPDRLKFSTDQFYFKSAAEMAELFRDTPDAIENTARSPPAATSISRRRSYFLPNVRAARGQDPERLLRGGRLAGLPGAHGPAAGRGRERRARLP